MYNLKKNIKKLDHLDVILMKLGFVFLTFFVLLLIPQLMNWLNNTNKWYILIAAAIFLARPMYKAHKK